MNRAAAGTYAEALATLAAHNPDLVVMTAENRAALRDLPARLGPRFLDVGICEQTLVGAAAGLALRGRVPVVHALAAFLTMRAFEFIRTDVGIAGLPVKLVGAVPGLLSDANGPTHQALEDVALMRGIPGMEVYAPADEEELVQMLPHLVARPGPCYLRFNATPAVASHEPFAPGRAERLAEGQDLTLLAYGFLVREALVASARLARRGLRARVLNLRTLAPVDGAAIAAAARETPLLVTVEDHFATGGLYSLVAEQLLGLGLAPRVLPIALENRWFRPGRLPDVLAYEGLTGGAIAARVLAHLQG